jgi:hypothetical protein
MTEELAMNADGKTLDAWMAWFESHRLDDTIRHDERNRELTRSLFEMFPVGETSGKGKSSESKPAAQDGLNSSKLQQDIIREEDDKVQNVIGHLRPRPVVDNAAHTSSPSTVRLGYTHRPIQYANQLQGASKIFHEEVARIAGISLERLILSAYLIDSRIKRWAMNKRERREFGSQVGEDYETPSSSDAESSDSEQHEKVDPRPSKVSPAHNAEEEGGDSNVESGQETPLAHDLLGEDMDVDEA